MNTAVIQHSVTFLIFTKNAKFVFYLVVFHFFIYNIFRNKKNFKLMLIG